MKKNPALIMIIFAVLVCGCSKNSFDVSSPDGKIKATVYLQEGKAFYKVLLNDKELVNESQLGIGLDRDGQDFTQSLSIQDTATAIITDAYKSPVGKRSERIYKGNELKIGFINQAGNKMDIVFRTSNDGVVFRYKLKNAAEDTVAKEITYFNLPPKSEAWIQYSIHTFGNYELHYDHRLLDTLTQHHDYLMPALILTPDSSWILLHDAASSGGNACSRLQSEGNGHLKIQIPGDRGRWEFIAAGENYETPWRVIMIGDKLGNLVESTLIDDLNPPSVIGDLSWIKPGVTVFPWWAISEANDQPDVLKKYIDLAAEMEWEYLEFDLACMNWYKENKPDPNFWRSVKFIPEIIKYAASKGIDCYGWDMRHTMREPGALKEIMATNKKLGLKGIKVDFINDDNQFGMRFREDVMKEAAEQQMMISFHGDMAPRGMNRTYPNLMTQEGVMGCEYYKDEIGGGKQWITPEHNCTLPFTRNLVGSMDYTPCALSATNRLTTYAHELAFSVICESGWLCMCDMPEAYLKSPAKDFLKKLEAAWDDTKFIDGFPGKFCIMARRHGSDWFVVGINSWPAREVSIPMDYLKEGNYAATLYCDGSDAMKTCDVKEISFKSGENLKIQMGENGGFAFIIQQAY